MQQTFTSRDVVSLTGITPRQLQWWDERRIVVPAREGRRRLYSMEDLAEIAVICELRQRGFSLQRVRKVMRFLQGEFGRRLAETVSGASEYHLLTDGRTLFLETSPRQIVDILKNARQPMLTICLSDTVRQVRAEIRARKNSIGVSRSLREGKAGFISREVWFHIVAPIPRANGGGDMVGELDVLSQWIPEQMLPGTIFVLENAGRVGEKDDPYWAVLSCPECGTLGLITRKQLAGLLPGNLRLQSMPSAVFHQR